MKMKAYLNKQYKDIIQICREVFTPARLILILTGTAIVSFGLYNVHDQVNITEGGVLGMILLLEYWFHIKPSVSSPVLNILCYVISGKALGKRFIIISLYSTICMTVIFRIIEHYPPVLPDLSDRPLIAAILGALFIGIGCGIVVRFGGITSGDDGLALFISKKTGWTIAIAYLVTDLTVLGLSLTYIPFKRIIYSLITVALSSCIIDLLQKIKFSAEKK